MLPWMNRQTRRNGRARRRPDLAAVELLETRALLANTPLGHALPDLTISGYAGPVASWGGPISVTVKVDNIGTSTQREPLNLAPGSTSNSDAPQSLVAVYASNVRHLTRHAVLLGSFTAPPVTQNNIVQLNETLTLPQRPAGFAGDGGHMYLIFRANADNSISEYDATNNFSRPVRVLIQAPLPELNAVALDVPPTMQPGDVIAPTIRVANLGTADTNLQGPVTVALVASVTPDFGPGSSILAEYTVPNIPAAASVPSQVQVIGDQNLNPPNNIVTIAGAPIELPTSPATYYIGVVVDPTNQIKQLQGVGSFRASHNPFSLAARVGPPIVGLPPAGVAPAGSVVTTQEFPFPASGASVGAPNSTTTTTGTGPVAELPFNVSTSSIPINGTGFGYGLLGLPKTPPVYTPSDFRQRVTV